MLVWWTDWRMCGNVCMFGTGFPGPGRIGGSGGGGSRGVEMLPKSRFGGRGQVAGIGTLGIAAVVF